MGSPLKDQLEGQGFVIVSSLIPPDLVQPLLEACQRVINKTRSGEWVHRRIVGKQFPPFEGDEKDSWGVQHLMHPDLGEPVFARWYGSEQVRNVCVELLDCRPEDLQMELFNLLINPEYTPFALRWHRDDVPSSVTGAEELERLAIPSHGVQWNTALLPDSSLYVVPTTHVTALSDPEQRSQCTPEAPSNPLDMPGCTRVHLTPGDTVFYNNNILHCAVYDNRVPRITLHACMGDTRGGGQTRARNILQHDLRWMKSEEMRSVLRSIDRMENTKKGTCEEDDGPRVQMWKKLMDMAGATAGDGALDTLGYSLTG